MNRRSKDTVDKETEGGDETYMKTINEPVSARKILCKDSRGKGHCVENKIMCPDIWKQLDSLAQGCSKPDMFKRRCQDGHSRSCRLKGNGLRWRMTRRMEERTWVLTCIRGKAGSAVPKPCRSTVATFVKLHSVLDASTVMPRFWNDKME